nr:hypothetical protein CFP56_42243 [Quercus suber]
MAVVPRPYSEPAMENVPRVVSIYATDVLSRIRIDLTPSVLVMSPCRPQLLFLPWRLLALVDWSHAIWHRLFDGCGPDSRNVKC